jgi:hypothetical protein
VGFALAWLACYLLFSILSWQQPIVVKLSVHFPQKIQNFVVEAIPYLFTQHLMRLLKMCDRRDQSSDAFLRTELRLSWIQAQANPQP